MANLYYVLKNTELKDRFDVIYYHSPLVDELKSKMGKNLIPLSDKITNMKRYPSFYNIAYLAEGVPCLRIKTIDKNGNIDYSNINYIAEVIHNKFPLTHLKYKDMIMAVRGNTIGKVAVVPRDLENANISANLIRIQIHDINPFFLKYFIMSKYGQAEINQLCSGALQFTITTDDIKSIMIPDINRNKQDEIVKEIEVFEQKANELLSQYNKKIIRIQEIIKKYVKINLPVEKKSDYYILNEINDRFDVLFYSPYLKELINKIKQTKCKKLGSLINIIPSKNPKPKESYNLVELENINEKEGNIDTFREVLKLNSNKIVLEKGTIGISMLQPERGKIVIIDSKYDGFVATTELTLVKPKTNEVSFEYLWVILRSTYILNQWKYQITGCSRERIGNSELLSTLIPIIKKQDALVKEVKEELKEAKCILLDSKNIREKGKAKFLALIGI